jgi:hypothetical protein
MKREKLINKQFSEPPFEFCAGTVYLVQLKRELSSTELSAANNAFY